jgi:outer membrane protein OmpA-like peptidoglycan-associated protein
LVVQDSDEDGIPDDQDSCRNEYGEKIRNGCPNRDAIVVPFEPRQSALFANTYSILDSVISVLRKDPGLTITIEGHAYKKEGVETICEQLSRERADIVRRYLLTRQIDPSRIESVRSFGNIRPITAGRNSWEKARNSRAEIVLVHH